MIEQKLQSKVQPREVSIDVDLAAEQRVAAQHARVAVRQAELVVVEARDRPVGVVDGSRRASR